MKRVLGVVLVLVLAVHVLGLTSDRVLRKWREKNPALDDMVATMQAAPLCNAAA